jgi:hypothetical protein
MGYERSSVNREPFLQFADPAVGAVTGHVLYLCGRTSFHARSAPH